MTLTAKSWSSGRKGDIMNINWTQLRHCSAFPSYLHCFGGDSDEASLSAGKTLAVPERPFFDATSQCQRTRARRSCQSFYFLPDDPAGPVPWEALWFLETPQVIFKVTGLCRKLSDWAVCPSLTFLIYCLINPFHHLPQVPAGTACRRCKGDG